MVSRNCLRRPPEVVELAQRRRRIKWLLRKYGVPYLERGDRIVWDLIPDAVMERFLEELAQIVGKTVPEVEAILADEEGGAL